jgi:predicted nucleic acid-binding protein
MTLVIDASIAVPAALVGRWSAWIGADELIAPSLLWSEATAAVHQLAWRSEIDRLTAATAINWLAGATVDVYPSRDLVAEAHDLARTLGWAKSYDAEYVVLARRLGIPLVTLDRRLAATASRFVAVHGPEGD